MKFHQLLPLLNENEIQILDADTQPDNVCVYQGLGKDTPPTHNLKNILSLKNCIINNKSVIVLTLTKERLNKPYTRKTATAEKIRFAEREGLSVLNENNEKVTILRYFNSENIVVQFEDGTIMYGVSWNKFKNRIIRKHDCSQHKWSIIDNNTSCEKEITMQRALELFKAAGKEHQFAYYFPSARVRYQHDREMNIKLNGQTYTIRRYGKDL